MALPGAMTAEKTALRELSLLSEGLIMGGTGNPTPDTPYFDAMLDKYLGSLFPNIPTTTEFYHALPTPEQFCPFVCIPLVELPVGSHRFRCHLHWTQTTIRLTRTSVSR
jgi:hypothetical protein